MIGRHFRRSAGLPTVAVVGLALATALGAIVASPVPVAAVVAICVAALVSRSALLVVGAGALLASTLSATSWQQLDAPLPPSVEGLATVVGDPERMNGAVRAQISVDERRYQVWARENVAHQLAERSVGERIYVEGTTSELTGRATPSLRRKHVAGRVDLDKIDYVDSGVIHARVANALRTLVISGATSMDDDDGALYAGLVLGDDRNQADEQQQAFRDSGLSHLLAVSGQNVAFLLILLQPLIVRFNVTGRVVTSLGVIVMFGAITRWEPSVMRAVVMASVVLLAMWMGRRISPWRTLGLAVTTCMLIDPFLAGSIGFLLSVGACCGIALLARLLEARIPGPSCLRLPLALTLAAQVGVAPVQVVVFGEMPLVAVLSNLFAAPLAAFTMMWGMTAGIVAGLWGGEIASLLHLPTTAAVSLLDWVARTSANANFGHWSFITAGIVAGSFLLLPTRSRAVQQPDESQVLSPNGTKSTGSVGQR